MNLGPLEITLIALLVLALFGYKKLPDAARAVGRSMRIFKGEMKGMKDESVANKAEAQTVRGEIYQPAPQPAPQPQPEPQPTVEQPAARVPDAKPVAEEPAQERFSDPTRPA